MKKLKSDQSGITIISLIITIIVMLILSAIVIDVGTTDIDESKRISFVAYMQTIQTKVDFIAEYDNYVNYGQEISNDNKSKLKTILNSENESFITTINSSYLRFFDSSAIASDLEIDNIKDEIIVDFNTREVISLNGIKYEGEKYYTQYYLPGGQKLIQQNVTENRTVSIGDIVSNIDGLNATFTIKDISIGNGTLSYGKMNSSNEIKWTKIINYTKKGEDFTTNNIIESGVYYFKLEDNITGKDNINGDGNYPSVELRLTNSPKLEGNLTDLSKSYNYSDLNKSENWAYATDTTDTANLKYYVWIPRYVYKLDSSGVLQELQFLRGTSDITTSGTYIDNEEWIEPEEFTSGTTKKTGVWVQVDTKSEINIIDVLSGTIL